MKYVAQLTYGASNALALYAVERFTTRPTDTPANVPVESRVLSAATVRRDLFDIGTTGGASRVGYGELRLVNDDGALDFLADEPTDGRECVIYVADDDATAFPGDYTVLVRATIEQVAVTLSEVRVRLRDRQVFTDRVLQSNRYGGTNVLPDGVDGIASDLKGKPKPVLYGVCFNVSPVLVNTSRLIYQVNDGAVRDVMAVYDSGALLTRGEDYASEAAMLATAPARGAYRVWKGGGMFRLGSGAVGEVTCDAVEGDWPSDRTAARIFARVCTERAGLDLSAVSSADLDALDEAQPATLGFYTDRETSVGDVLDAICRSVGAWWASGADGTLRIQRLEAPTETPVVTLTAANIEDNSLVRLPMNDAGLPAWRVTVRCVPNYTVQTSGLVTSLSADRRGRLAQPFQDASASNSNRDTYLLAPDRIVETLLACRAQGDSEATRLLTLYGTPRERYELTVFGSVAELTALDLGAVVELRYPRYGLTAGKRFRVIGVQLNPTADRASLTLWG